MSTLLLIDLSYLVSHYSWSVNGVLHLGAHTGEEAEKYAELGIDRVCWVDCNPVTMTALREHVEPLGHQVIEALVGERDGERRTFHVANNNVSSSVLELGTHRASSPETEYVNELELTTRTVDSLGIVGCNMLNLDLQGGELSALRGALKTLESVNYIYTEVNEEEVYVGCPLTSDIDTFLDQLGFTRVETCMSGTRGWGDAAYMRKEDVPVKFKIVSAGRNCAEYLLQTLESVEGQTWQNYNVFIVDDASDDPRQAELIREWCDGHDARWQYRVNTERLHAARNQYEAIKELAPDDDDVVVFLDLDGDQLAHPDVLKHLAAYYADGPLVTYGSLVAHAHHEIRMFPDHVVRERSYRQHMLRVHNCFDHLRTMSGKIAKAIPETQLQWSDGRWYEYATDYPFMSAALELADGRYKYIKETLLVYNDENPSSVNKTNSAECDACVYDCLGRPPLDPLVPRTDPTLPAEERRAVLREYGKKHKLQKLVETGTNRGETPWALKNDFAQIFTVELDESMWCAAVNKFENVYNVHCLHGDSMAVLPNLLQQLESRALFWLDGHFSGPGTAHGAESSPIRQELQAVLEDKLKHVILVDDARCFEGGCEHTFYDHYLTYPSLRWVQQLAEEHGYKYLLQDDIIRLTP